MMRRPVVMMAIVVAAFASLLTGITAPAFADGRLGTGTGTGASTGTDPVAEPVPAPDPAPDPVPDLGPDAASAPASAATSVSAPASVPESPPASRPEYGPPLPAGPGPQARTSGDPRASGAEIFQGRGFDTCVAPSYETMRAWTASPYRAVGVYIGGRGRGCPNQPNLTPGWVRAVSDLGWELLPLYVGSQSPCVHSSHKRGVTIDDADPRGQGVAEGRDAVQQARALGMAERSAIYLDMEAYDDGDADCAETTLAFVRGWDREVRRLGYLPGFYSSSGSGIAHLERARRAGVDDLPAAMWFARWKVAPSVDREPALTPSAWQPHRRIHQYRGNVAETHGGHRLNIDRNLVDAPVAVLG